MKSVDLDSRNEDALIELGGSLLAEENITFDVWGYQGQAVTLDITKADEEPVEINLLNFISHNYLKLKIAQKKYQIKIKNLILKYAGVEYLGGAEVENLEIWTNSDRQFLHPKLAKNIILKSQVSKDEEVIQKLLTSVELIPGCGKYAFDHLDLSLREITFSLPNVKWIAPVVAWFADNLDIAKCKLRPGIEPSMEPSWSVSKYHLGSAHKISFDEQGRVNYGGSIDDKNVLKMLNLVKEKGLNVIFYPLIMVDVDKKPWRGHLTGKAEDVEGFYQNHYRPFILHYATLTKGLVDAFIIGSELVGLTKIHTESNLFPFVHNLILLAADVREILGDHVKLTYAADWSEYHTSNGVLRPLDELWAAKNIDFVGIDAYFPLTNSRKSRIEIEAIKEGWQSGEGIDYWLDSEGNEHSFNKEQWNQWKNLEYWWKSEHWVWNEKLKASEKTLWQPKMKPIWFTEFGFPSIDKATNKPNVFYDPRSSDGGIPTYSSGKPDFAIQRKALRASLEFWQGSEFLQNMICWAWDSRGVGWQTRAGSDTRLLFADGILWQYGHWLDGKIGAKLEVILTGHLVLDNLFIDSYYLSLISTRSHDATDLAKITAKKVAIQVATSCAIEAINFEASDFLVKTGSLAIVPFTFEHFHQWFHGSKTCHKIYHQYLKIPSITSQILDIVVSGRCEIIAAPIKAWKINITAMELILETAVSNHKHIEEFQGKKAFVTGSRQESETIRQWQTPHFLLIEGGEAVFKIGKIFAAKGVLMNLKDLQTEAEDYAFSGVKLSNSYSHTGHGKKTLFKPIKKFSSSLRSEGIEGVLVNIGGKAFILAADKIWLQGSTIRSGELTVSAKAIELEGLIGSNYQGMKATKIGTKMQLKCSSQELSLGAYLKINHFIAEHYQEFNRPSLLVGDDMLIIRTDLLLQKGSIIAGRYGKVTAGTWLAEAVSLKGSSSAYDITFSSGAAIGIRNNVSALAKSAKGVVKSAAELLQGSNQYAAINAGFQLYDTVSSIAGIISGGGLISAGLFGSLGLSLSGFDRETTHHEVAAAVFGELETKVDRKIQGDLKIAAPARGLSLAAGELVLTSPEDYSDFEGYHMGAGLDFSRTADFGGKGRSYSTSRALSLNYGLEDSKGALSVGGSYSLSSTRLASVGLGYRDEDGKLDIAFDPRFGRSFADIKEAFSGDVPRRIGDAITTTVSAIGEIASQPSLLIGSGGGSSSSHDLSVEDVSVPAGISVSASGSLPSEAASGLLSSLSLPPEFSAMPLSSSFLASAGLSAASASSAHASSATPALSADAGVVTGSVHTPKTEITAEAIDQYFAGVKDKIASTVAEVRVYSYRAQVAGLKKLAATTLELYEWYYELERTDPIKAKLALPALNITLQTAAGLVTGGFPGAAIGAGSAIRSEASWAAIDAVAGEQIGTVVSKAVQVGASALKKKYPELEDQEAIALSSGALLATSVIGQGSGAIKQAGKTIRETLEAAAKSKPELALAGAGAGGLVKAKSDLTKPQDALKKDLVKDGAVGGEIDKLFAKKYDPDIPVIKEPWMKENSLSAKQKEFLAGKELYGKNPGNVAPKSGYLQVDTELAGGDRAARKMFKELTGAELPDPLPSGRGIDNILPDGRKVIIRGIGKSGHAKIEIDSRATKNNVLEKITFK